MPWGESADFDILAVGFWRSMMRAPTGGNVALGTTNVSPKRCVEPDRHVTGELEVLALVVADRHLVGVVQEDVGHHQDRVVEQAGRDGLLAFALVLELGHPPQLAEGCDAVEEPGQLGVRGHVALHEQHAPGRVEARRHQQDRGLSCARAELGGGVRHRHRVEVDDAVDRVLAVLLGRPAAHRAEVVAEVHLSRGLDPGEHAWHRTSIGAVASSGSVFLVAVRSFRRGGYLRVRSQPCGIARFRRRAPVR